MSSKGAATLAVVRDSASSAGEKVGKAEIGKAPEGDDAKASFLDALAQVAPTGVIAGYSAILTALVAAIALPTRKKPEPDQLLELRIPLWAVFVALAFFLAQRAYKQQTVGAESRRTVPREVWVSTFAFAVWGLASPGTWVTDVLKVDNDGLRPVLPLAVAVIGGLILSGLSKPLAEKLPPAA